MIFTAARLAARDVFTPELRQVLWKSLGLAALALVALWFAARWLFANLALPFLSQWTPQMPAWADDAGSLAGILASLLLALLLAYLVAPVSAVIAGFFLDDVAETVEARSYPASPPGRAIDLATGAIQSARFFGVVILGNLFAFALLLVPGVNLVAFFAVNGYLLGREYFEFAAQRYRAPEEAKAMRRRHRGTVLLAGLAVAALLAVPVLNLLAPLFAAAMMVHLHQRLAATEGGLPALAANGTRPAVSAADQPPASGRA